MKANFAKLCLFLCGLLGLAQCAFGQLRQLSVNRQEYTAHKQHQANARLLADTLDLPFWDDFSGGFLDSTKWETNGAIVSLNGGVDAPSLGVVLLDGTKSNGQPYSTDIGQVNLTDHLTSRPIDLSGLDEEAKGST